MPRPALVPWRSVDAVGCRRAEEFFYRGPWSTRTHTRPADARGCDPEVLAAGTMRAISRGVGRKRLRNIVSFKRPDLLRDAPCELGWKIAAELAEDGRELGTGTCSLRETLATSDGERSERSRPRKRQSFEIGMIVDHAEGR